MPYIDYGNNSPTAQRKASLQGVVYDYRYPEGLPPDFRPGNALHDKLRDGILQRLRESRDKMASSRHEIWRKIEWTTRAYIPLDAEEARIKAQDPRKPVSIVVPVSFMTRQTILTYLSAALGQEPMFPLEPRSDEDVVGVALLELLLEFQRQRKKWDLSCHTQWSDMLTYGIGAVTPYWMREIGYKVVPQPVGIMDRMFGLFTQTGQEKTLEPYVSYEGHRLEALDPWYLFPDPYAPIHLPEQMEYIGWLTPSNLMTMLAEEKNTGSYFNCLYLKHTGPDNRSITLRSGERDATDNVASSNPVDTAWMYWNLIPEEWGLGTSPYPEHWLFALSGDIVITAARKLKLAHNRHPVVIGAPDSDGRTSTPVSMLEVGYGLQEVTNWLINSHVKNVRKTVNNTIVYDPSMYNSAALQEAGEAGGLIPMRRSNYGRNVKDGIMQLTMQDITRSNVADAQYLMKLHNEITGALPALQGFTPIGGPERLPATESRGVRNAALSRQQHTARIISMQVMRDLGYILCAQTQQFMSEEVKGRVLGSTVEKLARAHVLPQMLKGIAQGSAVTIDPFMILCDYDVVPRDGTIPNPDNGDVLIQMMQLIMGSPYARNWNINGMIIDVARQLGQKDFDRFQIPNINATVMDDEQLQGEIEAGNAVPVTGVPNAA